MAASTWTPRPPRAIDVQANGAASKARYRQALIQQSIACARAALDTDVGLLADRSGSIYLIAESLCFAALLLTHGGGSADSRLARRIIDVVLTTQHRVLLDGTFGAFPMIYVPDRPQPDDDGITRELVASVLGILVRDHADALGTALEERARGAIANAIRAPEDATELSFAAELLGVWLQHEYGSRWQGDALAEALVARDPECPRLARLGRASESAAQWWALELWAGNANLEQSVPALRAALLADVTRWIHPTLPAYFGELTRAAHTTTFPWIASWLSWFALGERPVLPREFPDAAAAALCALPVLAATNAAAPSSSLLADLEEVSDTGTITAWRQPGLHVEARSSDARLAWRNPVAGARWETPDGSAWLQCRVTGSQHARCRDGFVHFDEPGETTIDVHDLGPGSTRMISNDWWLAGLHFATHGFQTTDARRTDTGLRLRLDPVKPDPLLRFALVPG